MDNRAPDFKLELPDGAGHLLRDALNVDVTTQGTVKTRAGYELIQAGNDCHSLWAPLEGGYALYVDDGNLYRIDTTKALIASGFGNATPVRYAQVYEAVYFTDGLRAGSYHPSNGPTPQWASATATTIGDQQLVPMPAGQHIAHHAGRLLVAVGSAVIYSEPFTPHLRDPARGFEMFPAPITCIVAVERGVVVVADKTYWVAGGFPAQEVRAVLEYGAPAQQPEADDEQRDEQEVRFHVQHAAHRCASQTHQCDRRRTDGIGFTRCTQVLLQRGKAEVFCRIHHCKFQKKTSKQCKIHKRSPFRVRIPAAYHGTGTA